MKKKKSPSGAGVWRVLVATLLIVGIASAEAAPLIRLKRPEDVEKAKKGDSATNPAIDETQLLSLPEGYVMDYKLLALGNPAPAGNPLAALWRDPEFVKRFVGSYGFRSRVEPELGKSTNYNMGGTTEYAFYITQLIPAMASTNDQNAVELISTNLTVTNSAIFDYTLGTLHLQKGNAEKAINSYQNALGKFPDYLRAHKNLGIALIRQGNYAEAGSHLTRTIELGGADGHAYGLLGFCLLSQGKFIGAEMAYRNAMMFFPDSKDWKLGIVKCLIEQKRLNEANRLVAEALADAPDDEALWSLQAGIFLQLEEPMKAAVNYEVLRKMGTLKLSTLMLLGDIYMSEGAVELALPVYLQGIENDGAADLKRSLRATDILVNNGSFEEAETMFAKIRELHEKKLNEDEELKLLKMESKVSLAQGDSENAIKTLEQVVLRTPRDGEALLMLGDHYAANGQPEKAQIKYDFAAKIDASAADANVKLAQLLVKRNKYDPAIELLKKAQKINPRDSVQRYLEAIERAARKTRS